MITNELAPLTPWEIILGIVLSIIAIGIVLFFVYALHLKIGEDPYADFICRHFHKESLERDYADAYYCNKCKRNLTNYYGGDMW